MWNWVPESVLLHGLQLIENGQYIMYCNSSSWAQSALQAEKKEKPKHWIWQALYPEMAGTQKEFYKFFTVEIGYNWPFSWGGFSV